MIDANHWFHRMLRGECPPAPVDEMLGERILRVDADAGELEAEFTAPPAFANPAGGVQGGMLSAMLDTLTAGLVDSTLSAGEAVATLALNTTFLRPARLGVLQGKARLVRRGREVCHVAGELAQSGEIVATATAICRIVRPR